MKLKLRITKITKAETNDTPIVMLNVQVKEFLGWDNEQNDYAHPMILGIGYYVVNEIGKPYSKRCETLEIAKQRLKELNKIL